MKSPNDEQQSETKATKVAKKKSAKRSSRKGSNPPPPAGEKPKPPPNPPAKEGKPGQVMNADGQWVDPPAIKSENEATIEKINAKPADDWNLWRRLIWVRQRVGIIEKAAFIATNRAGTKGYAAVTHDDVSKRVRPLLNDAGVMVFINCVDHQSVATGAFTNSNRSIEQFRGVYEVTFINAITPTQTQTIRVPAFADDYGDKGPGKAESYAMKYALLKTFLIPTGEDDEVRVEAGVDAPDAGRAGMMLDDQDKSDELYSLATELFGEHNAKTKLNALAQRRFRVQGWHEIPLASFKNACAGLRNHHAALMKARENE